MGHFLRRQFQQVLSLLNLLYQTGYVGLGLLYGSLLLLLFVVKEAGTMLLGLLKGTLACLHNQALGKFLGLLWLDLYPIHLAHEIVQSVQHVLEIGLDVLCVLF